jgi:hypothetical protein
MQIVDFTAAHIEQAARIAKQNYEEERRFVPALPPVEHMPDIAVFADNNMGVSAFEGRDMVGFLCSVPPFAYPFQIPDILGAYSPIHAHGTVTRDRARIYVEMYEAAAQKWVNAGAANHAIVLYAHDLSAQDQFFRYRFGLHGIDAIQVLNEFSIINKPCFEFIELLPDKFEQVWPLHNLLLDHCCAKD